MSVSAGNQKWVILGVALIFFVLAIFTPSEAAEDPNSVRPSSFLTSRSGGKALYLSAEKLGIECERWMNPMTGLDREIRSFVCLHPSVPITFLEADEILDWVFRGGRLLYAPAVSGMGGASGFEARETDPLLKKLKVRSEAVWERMAQQPGPMKIERSTWAPANILFDEMDSAIDGLGHGLRLGPGRLGSEKWKVLASRNELESGLVYSADGDDSQVAVIDDAEAIAGDVIGIAQRSYGDGEIVLLSDATDLINNRIRSGEPALFVLRLLSSWSERGVVHFDELHHGFKAGQGLLATVFGWLTSSRRGHACLGIFLLILLAVLIQGIRLGSPIPTAPSMGRSSLDHVDALANAYARASGRDRGAHLLLEGFRLRDGRGVLPAEAVASHLDDLAQAYPELEAELECIRSELEAQGPPAEQAEEQAEEQGSKSRVSLTQLAQAMDRVHAFTHAKRDNHNSLRVS